MKKLLTATAAICFVATQISAGSLAEPIVEPPVAAPATGYSAGSAGIGGQNQRDRRAGDNRSSGSPGSSWPPGSGGPPNSGGEPGTQTDLFPLIDIGGGHD